MFLRRFLKKSADLIIKLLIFLIKQHLQQFRSATLVTRFSQLRMNLRKLKEVFVAWYVMNKIIFQFSKLSFHLLRNPSVTLLVNTENIVFSAKTECICLEVSFA